MRIAVEAWSPDYGSGVELGEPDEVSVEKVETGCELQEWAPISPAPGAPMRRPLAFVDGTRRIDARVFLMNGDGGATPGVAGTVGVGAVLCELNGNGRRARCAEIEDLSVPGGGRWAVPRVVGGTRARVPGVAGAGSIHRTPGRWCPQLHARPRGARRAGSCRPRPPRVRRWTASGRRSRPPVDHRLHQGSRSPLPPARQGGSAGPFGMRPAHAGVCLRRVACPLLVVRPPVSRPSRGCTGGSASPAARCRRPCRWIGSSRWRISSARLLPGFASAPYWDKRAPQNLVPIAGLEKRLRHLMGERELVYRMIRSAAKRAGEGEADV